MSKKKEPIQVGVPGVVKGTIPSQFVEVKPPQKVDVEALHRKHRSGRRRPPAEFWADYALYLTTPEWKKRCSLVDSRCRGVCEGCGVRRATEHHHISYDHVFKEFLFEILGLCHECHARWHGKKS